ncbi:MAG TPA: maleylpyruvate isomerase family mycothiol-dependent enzyme [Ilumatobacteraceae bacterium]|nr:maleylpyruvate isomerase family mycothiol-dependent enzyme [Ilumatobacteraceae bacterium]
MQLTPRYGAQPVITLDGPPAAIAGPLIRQRRRLATALASFTDEQWSHPSRCAGWSNRDVIVHLDSTNTFWSMSIAAGVHGEPTRFLATFDPVASPAQLVAGSGDVSTGEVLARFVASTDALVGLCSSLDHAGWSAAAEAPPGHVSVSAVAHHALWDSWVHERDVLVPLGLAPEPEADEVAACLRYVAALGPALALNRGAAGSGVLAIDATGPDVVVVVDIGEQVVVRAGAAGAPTVELRLAGDAVELLEALSVRRPLTQLIPADSVWMLRGLSDTFDVAPD